MMQTLELSVLDSIQSLRCGALDVLLPFLTRLSDHGEIWLLLALVLLALPAQRTHGRELLLGLMIDYVSCNLILKPLIGRARPFLLRPDLPLLVPPPTDASFPSGHAAVCFAAVFALKASGSPLWKGALALALVTSFSRLYLYLHWPSDVLAGAVLGALAGIAGVKLRDYLARRLKKGS